MPLFVTNLMEGRKVPLRGDGHNRREWLHVDDRCRAIALVLAKGRAGEIYGVGGGNELTNLEMAARPVRRRLVDGRPGCPTAKAHDERYSVNDRKIRAGLGCTPATDLARGLAETVAWSREHVDWWKVAKYADGR